MLDPDLKLEWGAYPTLKFNNHNELFEALGEISNPKYCVITFEENTRTGSYSDVYRVRFQIPTDVLIAPIQNKITSYSRFNCNEFIQFFIHKNIFSYDSTSRRFDRDYQKILTWVKQQGKEYVEFFLKGYFDTINNPLPREPKLKPEDLLIINDNYVNQVESRKLIKKQIPAATPASAGASTKRVRKVDYVRKHIRDTELGLIGEFYVYQTEYKKLKKAEEAGLIECVEAVLSWVSKLDDSAGYDIKSYDPATGKVIYIEVKSTSSSANTPFFVSDNELEFSEEHSKDYKLYRLYNLSKDSLENIEYFELDGNLKKHPSLVITPKTYEVRIK